MNWIGPFVSAFVLLLLTAQTCPSESIGDGVLVKEDGYAFRRDGSRTRCERLVWFTLQEDRVWCYQETRRLEIPIDDLDMEKTFGKAVAGEYAEKKKELQGRYRQSKEERKQGLETVVLKAAPSAPLPGGETRQGKKKLPDRAVPESGTNPPIPQKPRIPEEKIKPGAFIGNEYKGGTVEVTDFAARIRKGTARQTTYDLCFVVLNQGPPAKVTVRVQALDGNGRILIELGKAAFLQRGQSRRIASPINIPEPKASRLQDWKISGVSVKPF